MRYRARGSMVLVVLSMMAGAALTLLIQVSPGIMEFASAADDSDLSTPEAWRLDDLSTMALEERPDIDWTPIESGTARQSATTIYEGDNVVLVWDAGPAKLITSTPFPYDEFIVILKGKLILTDKDGNSATYERGDMFVVPKGFTGFWEMPEEFRELVVIESKAYHGDP